MKIAKLLVTTSIIAGAATAVSGQGRPFNEVDANNDGMLSLSELEAVFGSASAARILARGDTDNDGALSPAEIQVSNSDESDDENDDQENDDQEDDDQEDDQQSDEKDDEEDDDDEDNSGEGGEDDDE